MKRVRRARRSHIHGFQLDKAGNLGQERGVGFQPSFLTSAETPEVLSARVAFQKHLPHYWKKSCGWNL